MSNYTIVTAWNGKDTLPDDSTLKVISGDEFHTEFTAVRAAVNSKSDLNGSATESFSATTATSGTNTTQVATTAFVNSALEKVYPVGAIFTTVTAYANSAAIVAAIGGTTWTAFGAGKVLIGVDSSDTDFDTVEETGGSKTHLLTLDEMPSHTHSYTLEDTRGLGSVGAQDGTSSFSTPETDATGGDQPHNNVQPYITVYMWKRTA
jgi:hypothetical protein